MARPADGNQTDDPLVLAGRKYGSRLIVGTGRYPDYGRALEAVRACGAEIVTMAVRKTNLGQRGDQANILDVFAPDAFTILPNTAFCYTALEAVRTCMLAQELLGGRKLVKLEIVYSDRCLLPNVFETKNAADELVKKGFDVLVYTNDDPVTARVFEDLGCAAIMPLGATIGSGLGIQNPRHIRQIVRDAEVPVVLDAGIGTASHAAQAMELGCDAVLVNTAIAAAERPVQMARAMHQAVVAGRTCFLAGAMRPVEQGSPSSPARGTLLDPA